MPLNTNDKTWFRDTFVGALKEILLPRLDEHDRRFGQQDKRFDDLEKDVSEIKDDARALKADVSTLQTHMREVKTTLRSLDGRVDIILYRSVRPTKQTVGLT